MVPEFLGALRDVAGNPLAFAAYALVVAAWAARGWFVYRPQAQAEKILGQYSEDKERTVALSMLIGEKPPSGLAKADLLEWVRLKSKEKTRYLLLVAYVATLATVITISGMAVFLMGQRVTAHGGTEEELRVRDKELAAFQLGQSKLIYTKFEQTLRYRLDEIADPEWTDNPEIQLIAGQMDEMLSANRRLYCVLEEHPCSVTEQTSWSEIFTKLDPMLRRQYVGRVQNAHNLGQLIGTLQIETVTNPLGGPIEVPILPFLARDAERIWVGDDTLLPDNPELREAVRELYAHAARNESPSAEAFAKLAAPILSYYRIDT